ncbi:MAG: hypothetical protein DRJ03_30060 [Chloroflexi bacterium]|nr:MAG: hypothetical protein DRJ03_30060 [Chloroflexota bacterium]
MAIQIVCNRCGRFIKNITFKQMQNLDEKKDGVCKICSSVEEKNRSQIERFFNRLQTKLNDDKRNAHENYVKLLEQQVADRLKEE